MEAIRRDMSKEDIQQIGAILGDNTKTVGSHVLAGAGPMYATVLIVHKDDWKLIATAYNKEMKRLNKIKV